MSGTILQQTFVVEYVVNHQMCDDCRRVEAKDTWNASVRKNKPNRCSLKSMTFYVNLTGSSATKNFTEENSLFSRTNPIKI